MRRPSASCAACVWAVSAGIWTGAVQTLGLALWWDYMPGQPVQAWGLVLTMFTIAAIVPSLLPPWLDYCTRGIVPPDGRDYPDPRGPGSRPTGNESEFWEHAGG